MNGFLRMGRAYEDTHIPQNAHQRTSTAEFLPLDISSFPPATYFYSDESKYKVPRMAGIKAMHGFKLVVFPSIDYCHSDRPLTSETNTVLLVGHHLPGRTISDVMLVVFDHSLFREGIALTLHG